MNENFLMYGAREKVSQQMSERRILVVDKDRTVVITVKGKAGSGKSTVAAAIGKALVEYGCPNVLLIEENASDAYISLDRIDENPEIIERILANTTVKINVEQAAREDII
jgi:uridine kinase